LNLTNSLNNFNLGNKIRASSGEDKATSLGFHAAHLCSYSTFQFSAFALLFHQGRSGPIAFQTWF